MTSNIAEYLITSLVKYHTTNMQMAIGIVCIGIILKMFKNITSDIIKPIKYIITGR